MRNSSGMVVGISYSFRIPTIYIFCSVCGGGYIMVCIWRHALYIDVYIIREKNKITSQEVKETAMNDGSTSNGHVLRI